MSEAKTYLFIGLVAVALALSIVQIFQMSALKNKISSAAVVSANAENIDLSSLSEDERMLYEHHGILPARLKNAAQQTSSPNMVGGC